MVVKTIKQITMYVGKDDQLIYELKVKNAEIKQQNQFKINFFY